MSSVGAVSISGMIAAAAQMQASTTRIANPNSQADLAAEVVNQIDAQVSFEANAKTFAAQNKMVGQLLDITA